MQTSFGQQLLDVREPRPGAAQRTSTRAGREQHTARAILCASCSARVTDASQRTEVGGRHRHTFFNPAGIVYQVACFATATGCCGIGPFSDEFSWFPGQRWQIGVCASCAEHLGWHFDGERSFTALIEARILEADD